MKIPKAKLHKEKNNYFKDMKEGLLYTWSNKPIRYATIITSLLSFLLYAAFIQYIPLFERNAYLGPTKYGIAMAVFTIGIIFGMSLVTAINIPSNKRYATLILAALIYTVCLAVFPHIRLFPVQLILFFMGALSQALVPIATILGGVMAEFFDVKYILSVCYIAVLFIFIATIFMPSFKELVNYTSKEKSIQ